MLTLIRGLLGSYLILKYYFFGVSWGGVNAGTNGKYNVAFCLFPSRILMQSLEYQLFPDFPAMRTFGPLAS